MKTAAVLLTIAALVSVARPSLAQAANPPAPEPPRITKLGTIDCDMVETTPIVFNGRLYRFEYVRDFYYKPNTTGRSHFRFVDVASGEQGRRLPGTSISAAPSSTAIPSMCLV